MKFEPRLLNFLDGCRWLFALFVVIYHTTWHYSWFVNMMKTPQTALNYVWWFLSHFQFAHFAVIGFFVISGFLVGGNALTAILRGENFLQNYLVNRFARIYVVFLPALLLTFVLDTLGRSIFPDFIYGVEALSGHYAVRLLVPELFQLQWIWSPCYGTNGSLWSLACEVWYYILFPLLLMPLNRALTPRRRLACFVAGVVLLIGLSASLTAFPFYFLIWMMGAFARIVPCPVLRQPALALFLMIAAVVVTRLLVREGLLKTVPELQGIVDLLNAGLFANLILVVRAGPKDWISGLAAINHRLAGFSYSLYAIHMPIVIFVASFIRTRVGEGWMPAQEAGPMHAVAALATLGAAIVGADLFARFTEARTDEARRLLRAFVARVTSAPESPQIHQMQIHQTQIQQTKERRPANVDAA